MDQRLREFCLNEAVHLRRFAVRVGEEAGHSEFARELLTLANRIEGLPLERSG